MTPPDGMAAGSGRTDRQLIGTVVAGAYVVLVALCFAYFYPIFVGQLITYDQLVDANVAGRPLDLIKRRGAELRKCGEASRNCVPRARPQMGAA